MSIIFLAKGTATIGMTTRDAAGNVTSHTPAQFTWDDTGKGGSVAIGELDPETLQPKEPITGLYGDWDAAGYLAKAMELLKPRRQVNIPDFKALIQAAIETDNIDICDYCPRAGYDCRDCIVTEWKEEVK